MGTIAARPDRDRQATSVLSTAPLYGDILLLCAFVKIIFSITWPPRPGHRADFSPSPLHKIAKLAESCRGRGTAHESRGRGIKLSPPVMEMKCSVGRAPIFRRLVRVSSPTTRLSELRPTITPCRTRTVVNDYLSYIRGYPSIWPAIGHVQLAQLINLVAPSYWRLPPTRICSIGILDKRLTSGSPFRLDCVTPDFPLFEILLIIFVPPC